MAMQVNSGKLLALAFLIWLCATVVIGLQTWVGDVTIYATNLEAKREAFHYGILTNTPPGGKGWGAVGALTVQKRVGVVYLAAAVQKLSGMTIAKTYKVIDTFFLFVSTLALFFFLRRFLSVQYSLIGLLYFAVMLPFTYAFQLFHPWDRMQLALWLALLFLCQQRHFGLLLFALPVVMLVKHDPVVLPLYYLMLHFRAGSRGKALVEAGVLMAIALATYVALNLLFPAPLDTTNLNVGGALKQVASNFKDVAALGLRFPPLIVFSAPLLLAFAHWSSKDRTMKASVVFALLLLCIFLAFSRFEEVRAQLVVLVLLLPSALSSLARMVASNEHKGLSASVRS